MKKHLNSYISFISSSNPSSIEIHDIFFKSFSLVCRDTTSGFSYYLENNALKKQSIFKKEEPETILEFSPEHFEIIQNILTIMATYHQETLIATKKHLIKSNPSEFLNSSKKKQKSTAQTKLRF